MEANELTLQALDLNQQASVLFKSGNVEEALAKVTEQNPRISGKEAVIYG